MWRISWTHRCPYASPILRCACLCAFKELKQLKDFQFLPLTAHKRSLMLFNANNSIARYTLRCFKNWNRSDVSSFYRNAAFFSELTVEERIAPEKILFDSIERSVRRTVRCRPGATRDPSKEIFNEKYREIIIFRVYLLSLAKMKRMGKHAKGGFLLGVIRAGAFYLLRYIKHAIRNEIVFVWVIRHARTWQRTQVRGGERGWVTKNHQEEKLLGWKFLTQKTHLAVTVHK